MKKTIAFFLPSLVILASCTDGQNAAKLSADSATAIINGTLESSEGPFSKMVAALRWKESHSTFCSSSIITDRILLTAAHCVETAQDQTIEAAFGINGDSTTAATIEVEKILVHLKYHPLITVALCYASEGCENLPLDRQAGETKEGDLALVLLKQPIPKGFSAITLNTSEETISSIKTGTAVGYGISDLDRKNPSDLRSMTSALTYFASAAKVFIDATSDQNICNGDSGGPLMANQGSTYIQLGVASYSLDNPMILCKAKAAVYTSVSAYADWIESGKSALLRQQEFMSAPWLNLKKGSPLAEYTSETILAHVKNATMECTSKSATYRSDFQFYPYFESEQQKIGVGNGKGTATWSFNGKKYEADTEKNSDSDKVTFDIPYSSFDFIYWNSFWKNTNVDMAKTFTQTFDQTSQPNWVNSTANHGDLALRVNDSPEVDPDMGTFKVTASTAESIELTSTDSQLKMTDYSTDDWQDLFDEKAECKLTIHFQ